MANTKQQRVQNNSIINLKNKQLSRLNSLYLYERQLWAEQLHDDFGQTLAAIKSFSASIKNSLDKPDDIIELTDIIETTANDLYIDCYDLMRGLKAALNLKHNLVDNLQACIINSRLEERGIKTSLMTKNMPQNTSDIINMFITRVFQDSLSTILRTDCCREINICVIQNIDNIQLTILIQTIENSNFNINCDQFMKIKKYAESFSCAYSIKQQTKRSVKMTLCTDTRDFTEDYS